MKKNIVISSSLYFDEETNELFSCWLFGNPKDSTIKIKDDFFRELMKAYFLKDRYNSNDDGLKYNDLYINNEDFILVSGHSKIDIFRDEARKLIKYAIEKGRI